ncbi:hypothetical protein [Solirubrobacter pauli]|nr:hypothetical protein [Solirubrobacter pauli]
MSAEERCRCGGPLLPAQDAVVPVLRCAACGRELPATAITAAAPA